MALKQAEAQVVAYQAKLADLEARIQAIAPDLQLPVRFRERNPIFARGEPLNLNPSDITRALQNLSPTKKAELLHLLRERERLESEQIQDDRITIDELIQQAQQRSAVNSADPDAWWAAQTAYEAARKGHHARLRAERGEPQSIDDLISSTSAMLDESTRQANADGFPPADDALKPRAESRQAESEPSPPAGPSRRASLPPEVVADIEVTERQRAEHAPYRRIATGGQDDDRLAPYRDKSSGSSAEPTSYPDS